MMPLIREDLMMQASTFLRQGKAGAMVATLQCHLHEYQRNDQKSTMIVWLEGITFQFLCAAGPTIQFLHLRT